MSTVGVGIVGLSANGGWAARAHVPALRAIPGYEIRAVSASSPASAEAAAREYGVPIACADADELAARPEVDLVVISVRVPHHRELVLAAVAAGKDVLCEWPLGNGLAEAEELEAAAATAGVRGFVGLQGRSNPGVRHVAGLVRDGLIGEVLSTTLVGSGGNWGETIAGERSLYLLDRANGAHMLTIPFGHSVDALCTCLGEFGELTATLATRRPTVRRADTGDSVPMTAYDQIAVTGTLESGAVASLHYRGGSPRGANLLWEINGTEGDLVVAADEGHLQRAELRVRAGTGDDGLADVPVPADLELVPGEPGSPPYTVAQAYARLLADLRDGTHTVPTFADAVVRHRMIDAIERAGSSGQSQRYLDSPA